MLYIALKLLIVIYKIDNCKIQHFSEDTKFKCFESYIFNQFETFNCIQLFFAYYYIDIINFLQKPIKCMCCILNE